MMLGAEANMNVDEIRKVLQEAAERFLANELYLLTADANERSLTHKFAEYLQALVGKDWSVDCEYNRFGDDPKTLEPLKQIVGEHVPTDATKAQTIYPDIIVHKRGAQGPNLIVIEAKKNASPPERALDWRKLERIREQYGYLYAAFLNFSTDDGGIELEL